MLKFVCPVADVNRVELYYKLNISDDHSEHLIEPLIYDQGSQSWRCELKLDNGPVHFVYVIDGIWIVHDYRIREWTWKNGVMWCVANSPQSFRSSSRSRVSISNVTVFGEEGTQVIDAGMRKVVTRFNIFGIQDHTHVLAVWKSPIGLESAADFYAPDTKNNEPTEHGFFSAEDLCVGDWTLCLIIDAQLSHIEHFTVKKFVLGYSKNR